MQRLLFLAETRELTLQVADSPVQAAEFGDLLAQSGKLVQVNDVRGGSKQRLVLVLSVQIDQPVADLLQQTGWHGDVIHKGPASAAGQNLAAQQKRVVLTLEVVLFEKVKDGVVGLELELRLHHGTILSGTQHADVSAAAQDQPKRPHENGFPRAGFTRDDVEVGSEFDLHLVNHGEISHVQPSEHVVHTCSLQRMNFLTPRTQPDSTFTKRCYCRSSRNTLPIVVLSIIPPKRSADGPFTKKATGLALCSFKR